MKLADFLGGAKIPDKNKKILVIDDEEMILILMEEIISQFPDTTPIISLDSMEAFEATTQHHFDIIIIDFIMPNLNGSKFIDKYRQSESTNKDAKILICSASRKQIMAQIDDLTNIEFLDKPIAIPTLIKTVESLLG